MRRQIGPTALFLAHRGLVSHAAGAERAGLSGLGALGQGVATKPNGTLAQPAADLVNRLFKAPWAIDFTIEQAGRIGDATVEKMIGTDPDQPETGNAVGFAGEQGGCGMKQRIGQLGLI